MSYVSTHSKRTLVIWSFISLLFFAVISNAEPAPGSLDTTFGSNGAVRNGSLVTSIRFALFPDGSILAPASFLNFHTRVYDAGLIKFQPNGSVDTSFGTAGSQAFTFPGVSSNSNSVHRLAGGKFLVVGTRTVLSSGRNWSTLMRVGPGGGLDTAFGNTGFRFFADVGISIAPSPTGRVYVLDTNHRLYALDANGHPDAGFNDGEPVELSSLSGRIFSGSAIAATADGGVAIVGGNAIRYGANAGSGLVVIKLTASGELDANFGSAGVQDFPRVGGGSFNPMPDCQPSIQAQPNQDLVLGCKRVALQTPSTRGDYHDYIFLRTNARGQMPAGSALYVKTIVYGPRFGWLVTKDAVIRTAGYADGGIALTWIAQQSDGKFLEGGSGLLQRRLP